ncbi:MAG: hypothetical protein U0586_13865 [Candidatus Brocadiaceae bacterium]
MGNMLVGIVFVGYSGSGQILEKHLPSSRKGTSWLNILKVLTCYRQIDLGSEFRFYREWYLRSAMGDLLGEDY